MVKILELIGRTKELFQEDIQAYDYTGQSSENFFANKSDLQLLSLPIGEHLTEEELEKVVEVLKLFGK